MLIEPCFVDIKYIISLLTNDIHPVPADKKRDVDFVIKILTEGQGYLTKRTKEEPYARIIFFNDDNAR